MARPAHLANVRELFQRPRRLKTVIFFVTSVCNARCRTCFYWAELNRRGDLTATEIEKLARSMPPFTDLWLSGGEPMLRKDLAGVVRLFYENNGVRWVNLPTNGLLPKRTAAWTEEMLAASPELEIDLNVALDGLGEMQDSIRDVPGNFGKTLETLEAVQPLRARFPRLRVNVNTVICAENFEHVLEIAEYVKTHAEVDGHYFNLIRGDPKEPALSVLPAGRLDALYRGLRTYYRHYGRSWGRRYTGAARALAGALYEGTLSFHNRVQLENAAASHRWPMPCTAGQTSIVIDYNGDVRACELRGRLGNLRDFDCDFGKFWEAEVRRREVRAIVADQCWCTHVCFIHDSLRHSPRASLYDVPLAFLGSRLGGGTPAAPVRPAAEEGPALKA